MKFLKILLPLLIFTALPVIVSAQTPPPPPNKPIQNPIDGGLAVLAAAGGIYAVKKLRSSNE